MAKMTDEEVRAAALGIAAALVGNEAIRNNKFTDVYNTAADFINGEIELDEFVKSIN